VRVEGHGTRLTLTGTASVPSREYDLKGVASLTPTSSSAPGFDLPFVVQGPWDDPLIFPDPESLIRRSPASAPLLDAVKDRKTRDAVRSVLERLSGGAKPAVAPDAAAAVTPAPASAPAAVGDAKGN
jgi:AsmA protein